MPEIIDIPVVNKGGAPRGNRNALRSGVHTFTTGKYPRGASYIARTLRLFQNICRHLVIESQGHLNIIMEAAISSAATHEGRRLLMSRWLRLEGDSLPVLDRATLLDRIGAAADARDRALRTLGLDSRFDANGKLIGPQAVIILPDNARHLEIDQEALPDASATPAGLSGVPTEGGR